MTWAGEKKQMESVKDVREHLVYEMDEYTKELDVLLWTRQKNLDELKEEVEKNGWSPNAIGMALYDETARCMDVIHSLWWELKRAIKVIDEGY